MLDGRGATINNPDQLRSTLTSSPLIFHSDFFPSVGMDHQHNEEEVDRLSELPEPLILHIISYVPTKYGIRTSVLSRRFRNLWTASSSLELHRSHFSTGYRFIKTTNDCFRRHDPSVQLHRLCLKAHSSVTARMSLPFKSSSDWISRASLIGLCDLSLHIHTDTFERLFPFILSLPSLQSLEIHCFDIDNIRNYSFKPLIPATFLLKDLKKLHLKAKVSCSDLTLFMAQQTRLEYLYFEPVLQSTIELSSQTLKVLKIISSGLEPVSVNLSFPRLEFLELKMQVTILLQDFQGEMPLLRWVVVKLSNAIVGGAPAIGSMLRSIANVKELTFHTGYLLPSDIPPFHMLTEPGKELPAFPNLRSIKLSTCFHEEGIQDLICLLQNAPVLETVKLDHVVTEPLSPF
ncbi:F-box family protein [Rhynchospora pubera]|uniref:F-box family protein n=1 Tax=Rhynchospora pubera TaxID=906938 RepID=A0AAV8H8K1_9POAL|nr:F-box family protein [Rhynchospora pubera]